VCVRVCAPFAPQEGGTRYDLRLCEDLGVHVHRLRVEGDDVALPDRRGALLVQPQGEVLLGHADVHGRRGQAEALVDGALWKTAARASCY